MVISDDIVAVCGTCNAQYSISSDDFWHEVYDTDGGDMGERRQHVFACKTYCPECGAEHCISITGEEYPIGAFDSQFHECDGCELIGTPILELEGEDGFDLLTMERQFEEIVYEALLAQAGTGTVDRGTRVRMGGGDLRYGFTYRAPSGDMVYIETKTTISGKTPDHVLLQALGSFGIPDSNIGRILIVSCVASQAQHKRALDSGVALVDIWDLLNWLPNDRTRNNLRSLVHFDKPQSSAVTHYPTFQDALNQALGLVTKYGTPQFDKHEIDSAAEAIRNEGDELKSRLGDIEPGREQASEYEMLCIEITKYLYPETFARIESQRVQADGLNRTDHVGILRNPHHEFWTFVSQRMNSMCVIFECKNSGTYITQGEVLTTEKYLLAKAFRRVAVMYTHKGVNKGDNAYKYMQGTMRENGYLILVLNDNDVMRMIEMRQNGSDPSDYLHEKTLSFLWNLNR